MQDTHQPEKPCCKDLVYKHVYAFAVEVMKWTPKLSSTYRYSVGVFVNRQCMVLLGKLPEYEQCESLLFPDKLESALQKLILYIDVCRAIGQMKDKQYSFFKQEYERIRMLHLLSTDKNPQPQNKRNTTETKTELIIKQED